MWPRGGMVTQRIANPFIPVRFWAWPPNNIKMDKKILKFALNTKNLSYLDNHTHYTSLKNSTCGDLIKIYLLVKNNRINSFKYQCESCLYSQASASLLSRSMKNMKINEAKVFLKNAEYLFDKTKIRSKKKLNSFQKIMNKSNILRKDCLLLPFKATLKALNNK